MIDYYYCEHDDGDGHEDDDHDEDDDDDDNSDDDDVMLICVTPVYPSVVTAESSYKQRFVWLSKSLEGQSQSSGSSLSSGWHLYWVSISVIIMLIINIIIIIITSIITLILLFLNRTLISLRLHQSAINNLFQ